MYLAITVAWLLLRGLAMLRVHRVVRRAPPTVPAPIARTVLDGAARLGMGRPPAVRMTEEVGLPFVFGVWRPVVVYPAEAAQWPEERLWAVTLHELAHVRRRDMLTRAIADAACAVYWINPLVWRAARRLRATAEIACDDMVLRAGVPATAYADELLQLARVHNGMLLLRPAIGVADGSDLGERVGAILGENPHQGSRVRLVMAALLSSAAAVAAASCTPASRAPSSETSGMTLNVSDGGPDISSNGAGVQARWVDRGRHAALFLTGDVDLRGAASGRVGGTGRFLLVQERPVGLDVFDWRASSSDLVPPSVRVALQTAQLQLGRLAGRHSGFPGSTLTGLPAWSDDPNAHVVQAGWLARGERYGLVVRGKWSIDGDSLVSHDDGAWLVLFSTRLSGGATRRLQLERAGDGGLSSRYVADDVAGSTSTRSTRAWAVAAFRTLLRIKPEDLEL